MVKEIKAYKDELTGKILNLLTVRKSQKKKQND